MKHFLYTLLAFELLLSPSLEKSKLFAAEKNHPQEKEEEAHEEWSTAGLWLLGLIRIVPLQAAMGKAFNQWSELKKQRDLNIEEAKDGYPTFNRDIRPYRGEIWADMQNLKKLERKVNRHIEALGEIAKGDPLLEKAISNWKKEGRLTKLENWIWSEKGNQFRNTETGHRWFHTYEVLKERSDQQAGRLVASFSKISERVRRKHATPAHFSGPAGDNPFYLKGLKQRNEAQTPAPKEGEVVSETQTASKELRGLQDFEAHYSEIRSQLNDNCNLALAKMGDRKNRLIDKSRFGNFWFRDKHYYKPAMETLILGGFFGAFGLIDVAAVKSMNQWQSNLKAEEALLQRRIEGTEESLESEIKTRREDLKPVYHAITQAIASNAEKISNYRKNQNDLWKIEPATVTESLSVLSNKEELAKAVEPQMARAIREVFGSRPLVDHLTKLLSQNEETTRHAIFFNRLLIDVINHTAPDLPPVDSTDPQFLAEILRPTRKKAMSLYRPQQFENSETTQNLPPIAGLESEEEGEKPKN